MELFELGKHNNSNANKLYEKPRHNESSLTDNFIMFQIVMFKSFSSSVRANYFD